MEEAFEIVFVYLTCASWGKQVPDTNRQATCLAITRKEMSKAMLTPIPERSWPQLPQEDNREKGSISPLLASYTISSRPYLSHGYHGGDETQWPEAPWGRRGLIYISQAIVHWRKPRQKLKPGENLKVMKKCSFLVCSFLYWVQPCFLTAARTISPSVTSPTVRWVIFH